jgi:hypothetical protein
MSKHIKGVANKNKLISIMKIINTGKIDIAK